MYVEHCCAWLAAGASKALLHDHMTITESSVNSVWSLRASRLVTTPRLHDLVAHKRRRKQTEQIVNSSSRCFALTKARGHSPEGARNKARSCFQQRGAREPSGRYDRLFRDNSFQHQSEFFALGRFGSEVTDRPPATALASSTKYHSNNAIARKFEPTLSGSNKSPR